MFRRALLTIALVVGSTLPVAMAAAQVPPEPGLDVTIAADTVHGGALFTVDIRHVGSDADELPITAHVMHGFLDHEVTSAVDATCPADTDPDNDPAVTFTCDVHVPRLTDAGTYDIEVYSQHPDFPDEGLWGTATLTTDVVGWWNDHEVVSHETDIFTGYTEFEVRFVDVPPEVSSLELQAWSFGEFPSVDAVIACTAGAPGTFTCTQASPGLPPLCVEDPTGNDTCDFADPSYFFTANEVPTGWSMWAVHVQPTRWEEGAHFANQNYDAGELLQDHIDLDTFELTSSDVCHDANGVDCYDNAYYTTWLDRWLSDLKSSMDTDGTFDVTVDGSLVTVDVAVPRLPVGAHGLSAQLAVTPTSGGDPLVHDLDCDTTGCQPLAIDDLSAGEHQVDLRLFNDHPRVTVFTYDHEEVTWGQDVVATIAAPSTIDISTGYDIVDVAGPEIRKGGKAAQVTFRLADDTSALVDDAVARAMVRPGCHVRARLDGVLQPRCAKYNPGHDTFSLEAGLSRTDPGPWTLTIEVTAPDGSGVSTTDLAVTRN